MNSKVNFKKIAITILSLIATAIFGAIILPDNLIQSTWEKHKGIKPEVYVSLNTVFVMKLDNLTNLGEESTRNEFFEQLYEKQQNEGIVPLPFYNATPVLISDKTSHETACMFMFFQINKRGKLTTRVPEIKDVDCTNCVTNLIYGENMGKKQVDFINVEFKFRNRISVSDVEGKDLEICGENCIRLKRTLVIGKENFLGSFSMTKHGSKTFSDNDYLIEGKYGAWDLEFDIPPDNFDRVVSSLILNCTVN